MPYLGLSDTELLTSIGVVQVAATAVLGLALKGFVRAYVEKKGANRADVEDLPRLTRLTEEVLQKFRDQSEEQAHRNREILERLSHRHDLRMAALEKRLAVHQEAYTLWYEMYAARHDRAAAGVASEKAQRWWLANSLYLSKDARHLFSLATNVVRDIAGMIERHEPASEIRQDNDVLRKARDAIISGVELPSLNDDELGSEQPSAKT